MKNVPSNLNNLKSKVDILDVDKLVPALVDLSKLSDVVKNDDVENDVYNAKITQKLVKLKIKLLLIMIIMNILLLKNLIS